MSLAITPRAVHPAVELLPDGRLRPERDALSSPRDPLASGLELAAIAADDLGRPLLAAAGAPVARQRRLVARIARAVATTRHRGDRRLRLESAAATMLLDAFEGARGPGGAALRREALAAHLAIFDRTPSRTLRESMAMNLERVARLVAREPGGADALARTRGAVLPAAPPYAAWFPRGDGELRVHCQVQDVFFEAWRTQMRRLGFRADGRGTRRRLRYLRDDVVAGVTTRFVVDYVDRGDGIFTAMRDPAIDVVAFVGHSDWWARIPRNLRAAPDQVGAKLIVMIMCFGKHFFHAMHERYPDAHIVTTKDPTEDPEDEALLRHLFAGLAARRSWGAIRRGADADRRTQHNFIFPDDARYLAGVLDEDRDGRLDRYDRFCDLGATRALAPAGGEAAFVPDPPGLHPRAAQLAPRELGGDAVFEAALMLNSLSYDNYWLDRVNRDQRVVAGGWHAAAPGDLAAVRMVDARQDGRPTVRLTVSARYARAPQPAVTAMVVYEGFRWWAARVPGRARPSPRDAALCAVMLVAHALDNADYPRPRDVFRAFLRRWGLPVGFDFATAVKTIEHDQDWESGSPKAVARFVELTPPATIERLERLIGA